jgi:hypothetical protein
MFAFEPIAIRKLSLMSARVEARYFRRTVRKLGG